DGIRALIVTGVQTCALPISSRPAERIAIRHGGVTVKDRDQGRFDAPVGRRTAAALWSQVVLVLTGDVRVVCAADGHDVLRGPGQIGRASCRESGETAEAADR